jgi:hypothetical protein
LSSRRIAYSIVLIVVAVTVALAPPRFARGADAGATDADEKSVYDPGSFTLSFWCGPPPEFYQLERFREIKDAGFTLALPPGYGITVEQTHKMLDLCQQVGLKALVTDSRMPLAIGGSEKNKAAIDAVIKEYAGHPALFGYFITDEPGAPAFEGLREVVAYLREKDPKHPAFINLLPTYGRDFHVLGTDTYEQYVREYVDKVKPSFVSYDHYHFTYHGDRPDFFENLETVRRVCLEKGVPFWNIVLAVQHFDYRNLTEPELRFEAMQTLAFGGRGLLWFTYWSPQGPHIPGTWSHALINPDGTRDPHYGMVKRINADTKAIGDALGVATSTDVFQTGAPPTTNPSIAKMSPRMGAKDDSPLKIAPGGGGSGGGGADLTVGLFEAPDGKRLAIIASRDYKKPTRPRAIVTPADAAAEVFDPAKKGWSPAAVAEGGVIPLNLPPGGGVLLRW